MKKIILKPKKDASLRRFHPWVFSGAVAHYDDNLTDGDLVAVCAASGDQLAIGHYQNGSICVRILDFKATDADLNFWIHKLSAAYHYRQHLGLTQSPTTNCFRLVHAEGDGLPGLIVDVYDRCAVLQCHSIGMHRQRALLVEALQQVLPKKLEQIYDKSRDALPEKYAATIQNSYLYQAPGATAALPLPVLEHGHTLLVDWETGQKTGFFLDQRDNRRLLAQYAPGKVVLNAFSYTGGFSVYALQAGAARVDSVDVSQKAIDLTHQNVALTNHADRHQAHTQDVLKFLQQSTPDYDIMIIDPPAFAKTIAKRHNAVQGYKRLNALALRQLKPGGILFTFSCSQVVDRQLFYDTIVAAAIEAGRQVRVMHHLTQPADHPVSLFHPEGAYLKGLVVFVE